MKKFEYQSFAYKSNENPEYNESHFFNELGQEGWLIIDIKGFREQTKLTDSNGQPIFNYGVIALCAREIIEDPTPALVVAA